MPFTTEGRRRWKKKYPEKRREQERMRRWRARQWLISYKKTLTCACGESDPVTIDFHHVDPTTKRKWVDHSVLSIQREIAKCVPICANCHRKGHAGRPRPEHVIYFQNGQNTVIQPSELLHQL
jgi:hypothetical protein